MYGNFPISVARSYLAGVNGTIVSRHLVGFCDASNRAYAAVVYLILQTEDDHVVRFVAGCSTTTTNDTTT
jgi:hypothetical protein